MTKEQQVKNIISFLFVLFGENMELAEEILNIQPDYLVEKFNRYILSSSHESDWGLHPSLRKGLFELYCRKYGIPCEQYGDMKS